MGETWNSMKILRNAQLHTLKITDKEVGRTYYGVLQGN